MNGKIDSYEIGRDSFNRGTLKKESHIYNSSDSLTYSLDYDDDDDKVLGRSYSFETHVTDKNNKIEHQFSDRNIQYNIKIENETSDICNQKNFFSDTDDDNDKTKEINRKGTLYSSYKNLLNKNYDKFAETVRNGFKIKKTECTKDKNENKNKKQEIGDLLSENDSFEKYTDNDKKGYQKSEKEKYVNSEGYNNEFLNEHDFTYNNECDFSVSQINEELYRTDERILNDNEEIAGMDEETFEMYEEIFENGEETLANDAEIIENGKEIIENGKEIIESGEEIIESGEEIIESGEEKNLKKLKTSSFNEKIFESDEKISEEKEDSKNLLNKLKNDLPLKYFNNLLVGNYFSNNVKQNSSSFNLNTVKSNNFKNNVKIEKSKNVNKLFKLPIKPKNVTMDVKKCNNIYNEKVLIKNKMNSNNIYHKNSIKKSNSIKSNGNAGSKNSMNKNDSIYLKNVTYSKNGINEDNSNKCNSVSLKHNTELNKKNLLNHKIYLNKDVRNNSLLQNPKVRNKFIPLNKSNNGAIPKKVQQRTIGVQIGSTLKAYNQKINKKKATSHILNRKKYKLPIFDYEPVDITKKYNFNTMHVKGGHVYSTTNEEPLKIYFRSYSLFYAK
ncbi:hypothetical protein HEP_00414800 [Hepatocystis sp. ex Piliocolobus tephrosceles]|nr:hypothetical protein HEP_00414800 [Hepatocystis sp. ex Piliocolobus tephrosceles]